MAKWIGNYQCLSCNFLWIGHSGAVECPKCHNIWVSWLNYDNLYKENVIDKGYKDISDME